MEPYWCHEQVQHSLTPLKLALMTIRISGLLQPEGVLVIAANHKSKRLLQHFWVPERLPEPAPVPFYGSPNESLCHSSSPLQRKRLNSFEPYGTYYKHFFLHFYHNPCTKSVDVDLADAGDYLLLDFLPGRSVSSCCLVTDYFIMARQVENQLTYQQNWEICNTVCLCN